MQDPLLSLSASAGSGKTHQLTMRYLNLLLLGAKPSSILTLTFTRKAAKEMEERIIKNIKSLYINKSNKDYIKNLEFINVDSINNKEEWATLQRRIEAIYKEILSEDVKITTIDSFFQRILKSFCWYVGVEYNFQIQEDNRDSICEFFLNHLTEEKYHLILNICYQKRQTLDSILSLCVFLDSFKEMLNPALFLQNPPPRFQDSKKRAMQYAENLKKTYYDSRGEIATSLQFYDFESLLQKGKTWLTKQTLQEYKRDKFPQIPFHQSDFESLKQAIYEAFREEEAEYLTNLYQIFQCFLNAKEAYYQKSCSLSFNAVASKVYTLLTQNAISQDFLYFRLDSTLSHILIDEFQDTSILQYEILKPLIEEIKSGIGQKHFLRSFFYVGDIKQSIYRFRGGNPELFKIASAGMHRQDLRTNYRSAKEIVEFVNASFQEKMPDFIPQTPMSNATGFVQVRKCENDKIYTNVLESLSLLKDSGVADERITILVFDNKSVIELAQVLQEANYKIVIDTSAKLINHNEVRAIIELLKFFQTHEEKFKEEFFMLLGLKETHSLETFLQSLEKLTPAQCILKIMEEYKIASLSAKKFLESCLQYPNFDDFFSQVENIALEVVSSDFSGIRIMTIHKSKGLEFENVFIVDKTNRSSNQREKLFFSFKENGVEIQKIYQHSNPLRRFLDANYQAALKEEEKLESQDLKNQLYVALTRAKNLMFIFTLTQNSAFDILNLQEGSYGDFQTSLQEQQTTKQNLKNEEFYAFAKHKKALENLGRQSEIHTKEQEENKQESENLEGIYYGIALHFALEQKIKHHLDETLLLQILKNQFGFFLEDETLQKIILRSNLIQKNKKFIEIMAKGIVKCEVPFLSNGKQKRLDLLVLGEKEAWIIDYKSGVEKDQHKEQVREYMESIGQILHKKIYGYVFYTSSQEGRLVEV